MNTNFVINKYENGSFSIRSFLSDQECDELIKQSEALGYEGALIQTSLGEVAANEVRNNDRILFDDYELADRFFKRLRPFLPDEIDYWVPSGLNEKFRFYKYTPEQYFNWHVDGSFKRDYFEVSKLTVLFYLNSDFSAGATEFEGEEVVPEKGMILVFPHKLRHQGVAPVGGVKYVLRSDVMYAKA